MKMIILSKNISILFLYVLLSLNLAAQTKKRLTVAQDGTGDFKTVQSAFNSIPFNNRNTVTIFIKNGIYKEKLLLGRGKDYVTLVGEDKFNTVLTYDDHTGKVGSNGKISIQEHRSAF
ncbi:MAG: pectinesterase family protein [Segetibacter sp.]